MRYLVWAFAAFASGLAAAQPVSHSDRTAPIAKDKKGDAGGAIAVAKSVSAGVPARAAPEAQRARFVTAGARWQVREDGWFVGADKRHASRVRYYVDLQRLRSVDHRGTRVRIRCAAGDARRPFPEAAESAPDQCVYRTDGDVRLATLTIRARSRRVAARIRALLERARPAKAGDTAASASPASAAPQQPCADPIACLTGCEGGSGLACFLLGSMYEQGVGVGEDKARALTLYQRACTGGEPRGCIRHAVAKAEAERARLREAERLKHSLEGTWRRSNNVTYVIARDANGAWSIRCKEDPGWQVDEFQVFGTNATVRYRAVGGRVGELTPYAYYLTLAPDGNTITARWDQSPGGVNPWPSGTNTDTWVRVP